MNFNECPRLVRKSSRRKLAGDLVTTLTKLSSREKTKKTSNLSLSPSPDQARHPAPCPRVGSPPGGRGEPEARWCQSRRGGPHREEGRVIHQRAGENHQGHRVSQRAGARYSSAETGSCAERYTFRVTFEDEKQFRFQSFCYCSPLDT